MELGSIWIKEIPHPWLHTILHVRRSYFAYCTCNVSFLLILFIWNHRLINLYFTFIITTFFFIIIAFSCELSLSSKLNFLLDIVLLAKSQLGVSQFNLSLSISNSLNFPSIIFIHLILINNIFLTLNSIISFFAQGDFNLMHIQVLINFIYFLMCILIIFLIF